MKGVYLYFFFLLRFSLSWDFLLRCLDNSKFGLIFLSLGLFVVAKATYKGAAGVSKSPQVVITDLFLSFSHDIIHAFTESSTFQLDRNCSGRITKWFDQAA